MPSLDWRALYGVLNLLTSIKSLTRPTVEVWDFWIYFDWRCFGTTVLLPLDRRLIVIVGGFFGVENLSTITTFFGLVVLIGAFLGVATFLGVTFLAITGYLGDLVLIGLLGVDIFFWGVGFFFICLDYLSFETSEADFPGVFVYFLSNFTSSFVSSIFYTDTG